MNYIRHLTGFFDKVTADKTLNPTHISLYIALFQFWNCNRFRNPISISRDEVMRISKICSKATYHKCLKELHANGYIKYEPSYNPFKGSHVFLFNFADDLKPQARNERTSGSKFEPAMKQVAGTPRAGTATTHKPVTEQAMVPSINGSNNINLSNNSNSLNLSEHTKKIEDEIPDFLKSENQEKQKSSAKKEKEEMPVRQQEMPKPVTPSISSDASSALGRRTGNGHDPHPIPTIEEATAYFLDQSFPANEANKFFNYFQSIGWLVGGKTPMANWQAAARNWMLNAPKFNSNERNDGLRNLDSSSGKDYSEPL